MNSTVRDEFLVCSGQEVVFKCVTRGSLIIAWSSEEYIGTSGIRLVFTEDGQPQMRKNSAINSGTFAVLVNVDDSEPPILESQLHINISSDHPTLSVACESDNAPPNSATYPVHTFGMLSQMGI